MAAYSSGGTKGRRRADDQRRAAYLAAHNIVRETGKCCICYATIRNDAGAYEHYRAHAGE